MPDRTRERALRGLLKIQDEMMSQYNKERQKWWEAINTLDSEREANRILTDEVERLRKLLDGPERNTTPAAD